MPHQPAPELASPYNPDRHIARLIGGAAVIMGMVGDVSLLASGTESAVPAWLFASFFALGSAAFYIRSAMTPTEQQ